MHFPIPSVFQTPHKVVDSPPQMQNIRLRMAKQRFAGRANLLKQINGTLQESTDYSATTFKSGAPIRMRRITLAKCQSHSLTFEIII